VAWLSWRLGKESLVASCGKLDLNVIRAVFVCFERWMINGSENLHSLTGLRTVSLQFPDLSHGTLVQICELECEDCKIEVRVRGCSKRNFTLVRT
jgi:hypothetical protein